MSTDENEQDATTPMLEEGNGGCQRGSASSVASHTSSLSSHTIMSTTAASASSSSASSSASQEVSAMPVSASSTSATQKGGKKQPAGSTHTSMKMPLPFSSLPTNNTLEPTPASGEDMVLSNGGGGAGGIGFDSDDGGVGVRGGMTGTTGRKTKPSSTTAMVSSQVGVGSSAAAPSHPRSTPMDKGLGLDSALGDAWKPKVQQHQRKQRF